MLQPIVTAFAFSITCRAKGLLRLFPHGAPTQSSFLPLRPSTPQGLKNWLCHALISLLQVDAVLVLMIPVAHVFKVANRNPCQAIRLALLITSIIACEERIVIAINCVTLTLWSIFWLYCSNLTFQKLSNVLCAEQFSVIFIHLLFVLNCATNLV